jgi:hypothetical protein
MPSYIDRLDDDDVLRLGELPVVPFSEGMLDRFPKASSADLSDTWTDFHPDQPMAKAEFKRVRDAWKEKRTTVGTVAEGDSAHAQQLLDARGNIMAQLDGASASGNMKKVAELIKALKGLDDLAPDRSAEGGTGSWELLTEAESACMRSLVYKMNGRPLEEDAEWFVALLARVPERPYEVHPAHIPLPEAGRPAMLTP